MASSVVSEDVFRLGRLDFNVSNCDQPFLQDLSLIFPPGDRSSPPEALSELRMGCNKQIELILDYVSKHHLRHLRLSSVSLVTPAGHTVMVSGAPDSELGESALALSLAYAHQWKILAAGWTLINLETEEIIDFAAPLWIKEDTARCVKEVTGVDLPQPVLDQWLPLENLSISGSRKACFDLLIHLDSKHDEQSLDCVSLTLSEFMQRNFRTSNILRTPGASDKFAEFATNASAFAFRHGSVQDRVDQIIALYKEKTNGY